jgi:uncharacterized Zn-finger protein
MSTRVRQGGATPNRERRLTVRRADLPLYCPTPDSSLWNSHPRVFIPLEDAPSGTAICPYCGTEFQLEEAG